MRRSPDQIVGGRGTAVQSKRGAGDAGHRRPALAITDADAHERTVGCIVLWAVIVPLLMLALAGAADLGGWFL